MAQNKAKELFKERVVEPARSLNVNVEDVSADPSEGEVRGVMTIGTDNGERSLRILFERERGDTELTLTYERSEETLELEAELEREEADDRESPTPDTRDEDSSRVVADDEGATDVLTEED